MKKLLNLPSEGFKILIIAIINFIVMVILSSCATTSIYGCSGLIGPDHDKCMENYAVRNAMERQREMVNPR